MPRPNRWARAATNALNVLVHRFDVDEPEGTLTGPEMYALAEPTASVITLILLQEIGHQSFRWARKKCKYAPSEGVREVAQAGGSGLAVASGCHLTAAKWANRRALGIAADSVSACHAVPRRITGSCGRPGRLRQGRGSLGS
jgi:hypothetical protein